MQKSSTELQPIYTFVTESPVGKIRAASTGDAIKGLWFIGQMYFPKISDNWIEKGTLPIFKSLETWLKNYFKGKNPKMDIPLSYEESISPPAFGFTAASDFRKAVWKILLDIPYGETCTYREISDSLIANGIKASAQAVGGAVGHNPISLLIPCHRVIGSDGSLTGYAGGIEKKKFLLELEGKKIYD